MGPARTRYSANDATSAESDGVKIAGFISKFYVCRFLNSKRKVPPPSLACTKKVKKKYPMGG